MGGIRRLHAALIIFFVGSLFVKNSRTPAKASLCILIVNWKTKQSPGSSDNLARGKPQASRCFPLV